MKTTLQRKGILWIQILLLSLVCLAQLIAASPAEEPAAVMPQIQILTPCTCENNAQGRGTGQFSESILVQSAPDETWTVVQVSGLYRSGVGVPPQNGFAVEPGDVLGENGMNPGQYSLEVVHIDGIGYTLSVSNGTDTLSVSNRCFYPNPQINLTDNYCINHPVVPIQVVAPPYNGFSTVTVNGQGATQFNPAALGVGTHLVSYTFSALPLNDSFPGCFITLEKEVQVTPNYVGGLSCTHINVGLNENGFAKITPDMLLLGNYGCTSTFLIDIIGKDTDTLWCSDIGKTYMVKVTDPIRNNTCWANVTPEDKRGPDIQCQDTTLFCGTDLFNRPFTDFVRVTDNCDPNFQLILLHQTALNNPSCNPNFSASITRTYRATDKYGNTRVCTHTIFLDRPTMDDIQAPADVTLACDAAMDLSPEALGYPHVNGQEIGFFCEFSITHSDFSFTTCPGSRMIKRTFWVTDLCSREMRMLAQIIQILDEEAPIIACPANITLVNDPLVCSAAYRFPAITATDNCVPSNQITLFYFVNGLPVVNPLLPVNLPVGENQLTIWAQDPCLNIGVCQYTVTVLDTEAPNMACNPFTASLNADGTVIVPVDSLDNFYMDNCGLADTLMARMDDMVFGKSATFTCADIDQFPMVVVQVTDIYGNSNTCMITVEVQDKLGPNILYCPASVTLECNVQEPDLDDVPIFEDNCDPNPTVVPSANTDPGCCNTYTIIRDWVATDNMGNTSVCRQVITVSDQTPPTVSCLDEFEVYLDSNGEGEVTLGDIYLDATDVCCENLSDPDFTSRLFTCSDLFTTQFIVIQVSDDCGNTGSCEVAILVLDTISPIITVCPDVTLTASELGSCDLDDAIQYLLDEVLEGTDNCDPNPVIFSSEEPTILEALCAGTEGVLEAELVFGIRDASGNENAVACVLNLTYEYDIQPEVVFCEGSITLELDENGEVTLDRATVFEAEHIGPCAGITIAYNEEEFLFTCDDIGVNTLEIIATQSCTIEAFATAVCVVEVTIEDNQAPVLTCPANATLSLGPEGTVILDADILGITATDNCEDLEYTINPLSFDCDDLGQQAVFVTVSDEAGNTDFCSMVVTVEDNTAPAFTNCADVTLQLSDVGTCALIAYRNPALYGLTALDACDGPIAIGNGTSSNVTNFCTPGNEGQASGTITFQVSDLSGNTATCELVVTVVNDVAPVITCEPDVITVELDDEGIGAIAIDDIANATFPLNCPVLAGSIEITADRDLAFTCADLGSLTVTLTATICDGLSATCVVSIDVVDETRPTIDCPDDVTVSCELYPGFDTGEPLFDDNCTADITFTDDVDAGCGSTQFIVRTWVAEDESGNTNTCVQQIEVIDTTPPVLTCPTVPIVLELNADGEALFVTADFIIAQDNCPGVITFDPADILFTCDDLGENTRSIVVTDECNNASSCTVVIEVVDNQMPEFTNCQPLVEFLLSDNMPCTIQPYLTPARVPEPDVLDNCGGNIQVQRDTEELEGFCDGMQGIAVGRIVFTATDPQNNTATCVTIVHLIDDVAPEVECVINPAVVELNGLGEASVSSLILADGIGTRCNDGAAVVNETFNFNCGDIGSNVVAITVRDCAGNTGTCSTTIIVEDNLAPEITCVLTYDIILDADGERNITDPTVLLAAPVTDNCSVSFDYDIDPSAFSCADVGNPVAVTLTVSDESGNSTQCIITVSVTDQTAPEAICQDITVALGADGEVSVTPADVDNGSDDACGIEDRILDITEFTCDEVGVNVVILTVNDPSGNSDTCTANVTITDETDPVAICQSITLDLDANGVALVSPLAINNGSSDACGILSYFVSPNQVNCTHIVTPLLVVLTVTDENGNTATCSANVTARDTLDPVALCPAHITVDNDPGDCGADVLFVIPAPTDNCGATSTPSIPSGSFFEVGTEVVVITATDASGNSGTCSFTVIVLDAELPTVQCPPAQFANTEPGICSAVVNFNLPSGGDNCGVFSVQSFPASGSVFAKGTTIVTVVVTDINNNTSSCTFTVNVLDAEPPVAVCPQPVTVDTDPGQCSAIVIFNTNLSTDNCPGVTAAAVPASGSVFTVGVTPVVITATDAAGNSSTCQFTVTVEDNEAPIALCPANITVDNDPGDCGADVSFVIPAPTDNCGATATASILSGSFFEVGTEVVVVTATDASGNSGTCSFTVTVLDAELPTVQCPPAQFANTEPGICSAVVNFNLPSGDDNCGVTSVQSFPASGSVFARGTTIVIVVVTDENNNTNSCTFTVNVLDTEPPVAICPPSVTVDTDPGLCSAVVNFNTNLSTDNCPNVTTSAVPASGSVFLVGTTVVVITATDASGNSDTCQFTVTVEDNEVPLALCPANITVDNDPGDCGADVSFVLPAPTDNCSATSTASIASGSFFEVGTEVVVVTATDVSGNSDTCSFTVTVLDAELPTVQCPPAQFADTEPGICSAVVNFNLPTGDDNCAVANVQSFPASGSVFSRGATTVTVVVTDENNNTNSCTFTVTVLDAEPPVAVCPPSVTVDTDPGLCSAVVNFNTNLSTDNCPGVTVSAVPASGSVFSVGTTAVVITATDASGNSDTCQFTVTVEDNEAPVALCPANITVDNDPGECGADVFFVIPAPTDNCGATSTPSIASGSFFEVGTEVVVVTATDAEGNSGRCQFSVTVLDVEAPTIQCPDDITELAEAGLCSAEVLYSLPAGNDNCDVENVSADVPGFIFPVGETTIVLTIEDIHGNTNTCSFIIEVVDEQNPTIICPDPVTVGNDAGDCGAIVNFDEPAVSDNCSGATYNISHNSGSFFPVGTTVVSAIATDASGNTAFCSFNVVVEDTELPLALCPNPVVQLNGNDSCGATVNFVLPQPLDNCPGAVSVASPPSGSFFTVGEHIVIVTATDVAGNSGACSFTVTVLDIQSPIVSCSPTSVTITCADDLSVGINRFVITYDDNCGVVDTSYLLTPNLNNCGIGTVQMLFSAFDEAGNVAECERTINVVSDPNFVLQATSFEFPQDLTLTCEEDNTPQSTGEPVQLDVLPCADVNWSHTDNVQNSPAGCVTITRTWLVTDVCSGQTLSSVQIIVQSAATPFIGVPVTTPVEADADECEAFVSLDPAFSGACGADVTIENDYTANGVDASSIYPVGTTTVVFTATNSCGNTATATIQVVVLDMTAPAVECPVDQTISCLEDAETFALGLTYVATDACGIATTQVEITSDNGDCGEAVYTVQFTATDSNANTNLCTFTLSAVNLPLNGMDIVWPDDVTLTCELDTTVLTNGAPSFPPNCSVLEVSFEDELVVFADNCDVYERTWLVRDTCLYNPATGEGEYIYVQQLFIPDYAPLINQAPVDLTIEVETDPDSCEAFVAVEYPLPAYCAIDVTIENSWNGQGADASGIYPVGTTVVYFTATNGCDTLLVDSITVVVADIWSPQINCGPPTATASCADDIEALIQNWPIVVTEACPFTTSFDITYNLSACGVGTVTFVFQAIDESNNDAECQVRTITVTGGNQTFDEDDIQWPAAVINLTDCGADISPAALGSEPVSLNPYLCLGLLFAFDDTELTPQGDECRRVERVWSAISTCDNDTLASFTQLIIIEPQNLGPITIMGISRTEYAAGVPYTEFLISNADLWVMADQEGRYGVTTHKPMLDMEVIPSNNHSLPLHGVSISDLTEMNRYLHGKERYLSPYQIIAADLDRNGVVNTADAQILREVILGIREGFPVGNWRFIDNDYAFNNPKNPLAEAFPETKWLPIMPGKKEYRANFVGVKMGDLNSSYQNGAQFRTERPAYTWTAENKTMVAGRWNEIPVYAADLEQMESAQFTITMQMQSGEQCVIEDSRQGQLYWVNSGHSGNALNVVWYKGEDDVLDGSKPVFTLKWYVNESRSLKNEVAITSDATEALQYLIGDLEGVPHLIVKDQESGYALYQNEPNPFADQTWVPFYLPEAEMVRLRVFDAAGKQVMERQEFVPAGNQSFMLDLRGLEASGIYYYKLEAGTFSATKKMVRSK
jgi:hypothetical protein